MIQSLIMPDMYFKHKSFDHSSVERLDCMKRNEKCHLKKFTCKWSLWECLSV